MANNWKKIWEQRTSNANEIPKEDINGLFAELKRTDGFDLGANGGLSEEALIEQYNDIKRRLLKGAENKISSVYEVGCGAGPNLLLFERDGFLCGGIDYSSALIKIAGTALKTEDLICSEAINTQPEPKYDCVFANSVFSYFPDHEYALQTLEKMYLKANYSIGLIDVHNIEKQDEFTAYRRKMIENYDEKYSDLHKLFYSKEIFASFAENHNMRIDFSESTVKNYWNNEFVFNCFMYK